MNDWKTRLAHAKALRDAIALCNGVDLNTLKDPPDGLVPLKDRSFFSIFDVENVCNVKTDKVE